MAKNGSVSMSVIKRMPRYYRFLGDLKSQGISRISSRELSLRMGLTASQIRQDFSCFGGFGQQGYGYNVSELQKEIAKIIGLGNIQKTLIIGAGNLGKTIAMYVKRELHTFEIIGIFDRKESMVGQMVAEIPIRSIETLEEFCKENLPTVAVLCVPFDAASEACLKLAECGIKAVLNFTHYDVALNFPQMKVENIHMNDSFMTLCYKINSEEKDK
ncbi:MAG: redox-sensing transcriptional repressor Rex [Acutalibacteraceae bacterium]